jgi:hypothetical protein
VSKVGSSASNAACGEPPCFWDVPRHRGRCRCNPRRLRSGGRVVGCYRAAPAISRDHRQREGACARPDHRRMEAAAVATVLGDTAASSEPRRIPFAARARDPGDRTRQIKPRSGRPPAVCFVTTTEFIAKWRATAMNTRGDTIVSRCPGRTIRLRRGFRRRDPACAQLPRPT